MEGALYGNEYARTGAVTRLLKRTPGTEGRALMLTGYDSVTRANYVTGVEWKELWTVMGPKARRLTLIPEDALAAALRVYGKSDVSVAILKAMRLPLPHGWDDAAAVGAGNGGNADDDADSSMASRRQQHKSDDGWRYRIPTDRADAQYDWVLD